MSWEVSLDKYLTTPPDDGFDGWSEDVCNGFTESFYKENEQWITDNAGLCIGWLGNLFYKGGNQTPKESAMIIERAFRIYKLKK